MDGLWLSFGVVFIAELGDKSQLMALTFSTRYRAWQVLIGIFLATALVNGISVLLGGVVSANFPTDVISIVAGLAFLGFGLWTLRGEHSGHEESGTLRQRGAPILAVGLTFFLAEFGDKTMLATIALASTASWQGVWVGSTLGMVAANALAIVIGSQLGARLPERVIRIGAAILFLVFGALLIWEGLRG